MNRAGSFVYENIFCLEQGIAVLESISDYQYRAEDCPHFTLGGVGKQFRHVIDFYNAFLRDSGNVDAGNSRARIIIDYDRREREPSLESDRNNAIQRLKDIIGKLREEPFFENHRDRAVSVAASESSSDSNICHADSTIGRELQFLIIHTIHHYAIIALMLRIIGVEPPENFGVAPATIRYLETLKG